MHRAQQEISPVDVIDVNHVGVCPPHGPRLNNHKRIAAVLELWRASDDNWMADGKRVLPAKVRAETVVRNTTALLPLNGVVLAIILAGLLVRMFVSVLIGLMVRVFVLLLVFILVDSFVFLSILRMCILSVWLCAFLFLRMRFILRINRHGKTEKCR